MIDTVIEKELVISKGNPFHFTVALVRPNADTNEPEPADGLTVQFFLSRERGGEAITTPDTEENTSEYASLEGTYRGTLTATVSTVVVALGLAKVWLAIKRSDSELLIWAPVRVEKHRTAEIET